MKVASWNVNSVKVRRERLLRWLSAHEPDVLCLQELKAETAAFPYEDVAELGYEALVSGQRTYNGVAILSREPAAAPQTTLPDEPSGEARFVSGRVRGVTVLCCYVPNGSELESPKYVYKLAWLERLTAHLAAHHSPEEPLVVCGDFNIAPDDRDTHAPDAYRDNVLGHSAVRDAWRRLADWGLADSFRLHHPEAGHYSWWDYRMLAFPKGRGARIDFVLATAPLAARCSAAYIDREERKGKQPSDHAPVVCELSWP